MTHPPEIDALLVSARRLADAGEWRDAAALLALHVGDGLPPDALLLHGEALMRSGEERAALPLLRRVIPALRGAGAREPHRRALNMIGVASFALGALDDATDALGQAVDLATQDDDALLLGRATNNLGVIANLQGRHEDALWHYRLALPSLQRLGQPRLLAECYHNMAITLRDTGKLEDADEYERRSIEYAADGGAPRVGAMGRVGRAEVALRRGDAPLAERTARLAAEELARLGDPMNEADAHRLTGAACAAQQRYADALEAFDRSLALSRARGHALAEAEALRDRVQAHVGAGERALAIADAESAIEIFRRLGAVYECEALEGRLAQLRA